MRDKSCHQVVNMPRFIEIVSIGYKIGKSSIQDEIMCQEFQIKAYQLIGLIFINTIYLLTTWGLGYIYV